MKNEGIGAYMPALSGRETPWVPIIPLAAIVGKKADDWCNGVAGPSCFAQLRYINGSNEGRLVISDPNGPISVHTLTDRTVVGKFAVRPLAGSGCDGPSLWGPASHSFTTKKNSRGGERERRYPILLGRHRCTTLRNCTSLVHMMDSIMMLDFVVNMSIATFECGPRKAPSKGHKVGPDRIAT